MNKYYAKVVNGDYIDMHFTFYSGEEYSVNQIVSLNWIERKINEVVLKNFSKKNFMILEVELSEN